MLDSELANLIDERAIRLRLFQCARSVDRGDADGLASSFTSKAQLELGYYNGPVVGYIARFRAITEAGSQATPHVSRLHHRIANILCVVSVERDRARTESYYDVRRRLTMNGVAVDEIAASRALDRWELTSDGWKIAHRVIVWDWSTQLSPATAQWENDPSYLKAGSLTEDPSRDFWSA